MAATSKNEKHPSREERYLKLLKGEISSAEFARDLKKQVRSRSRSVEPRYRAGRNASP